MTDSTSASPVSATPAPATTAAKLAVDIEAIAAAIAQVASQLTTPTALTALEGFFTALPGMTQIALKIWAWADTISGGNPGTLISNFGSDLSALMNAKTKGDRNAAIQSLAGRFSHLP